MSNLALQQRFEAHICRWIKGEPDLLLDVGVGPKTEWQVLEERYPDMALIGWEPHPEQFARLWKVFPGTMLPYAAWDSNGPIILNHNPENVGASSVNRAFPQMKGAESFHVAARTLDCMAEHKSPQGDTLYDLFSRILLWMDIEGAEHRALLGAEKLLASGRVKWINLEELKLTTPVPNGWADPQAIIKLLARHGFERVEQYNAHPKHQDVIYVHRSEL